MQGLVVLPEDVQIVPLSEMAPQVRSQISGDDGDFALTRPLSRAPSKVIDANSASLLRQFRSPKTIIEGLIAFSKEIHARPADVLDDAYPLIESCLVARLLVEPGEASGKIEPAFTAGALIGGHLVERCIQALIDSEVYEVTTPGGRSGALKIATARGLNSMKPMLEREARVLTQLAGRAAPALLETGILSDGRHYILTEWIDGEDAQTAAWKLREQGTNAAVRDLSGLCADVLDAYATLHDQGLLHGDVHPRNVFIADSGEVRLIDFGVSGCIEDASSSRAGVAFFFDPQYADSLRAGKRAPALSLLAEQYSVAALIYTLLCGPHYI
ncbi:MAG: hypothetical protein JWN34_868, partial [Bryobacterales bacterium]|nr:hypothetical protein [Bryobacterales bacterium]